MKLFKITILLILFYLLIVVYSGQSRNLQISYWDEMQWVGQSYLFQFYSEGNFDRNIWDTFNSLDQPTLAKFSYGAWLYPVYLAGRNNKKLDYTKFLIINGFYLVDGDLPEYLSFYSNLKNRTPEIQPNDAGYRDDYIEKYGVKINKPLDLIFYARKINFIYLALSILLLTLFFYLKKGFFFAFFFLIFYGLNTLLIRNGVKAHADGLFILLFNASLLALYFYFYQKKRIFLFIFSFLSGLAMSTKLNGIMLYLLFLPLFFCYKTGYFRLKKKLFDLIIPFIIMIGTFILFNPFVHSNIFIKIFEMYKFRAGHTMHLSQFYIDKSLANPFISLWQIFLNFFHPKFIGNYNIPIFMHPHVILSILLFFIFIVGVYSEYLSIKKKNDLAYFMLLSFAFILLITAGYLRLNWDRYQMHLVLFFIYYQVAGIIFIIGQIKLLSKK